MNEDKGEKIVLKIVMRTRKIFILGEKTECTDANGVCWAVYCELVCGWV
jgi:hypothetical protein